MHQDTNPWSGAMIGGTFVAVLVAIVVLVIVSVVVGIAYSLFQYYFGGAREGVAIFLGVVVGGIVGVYAARAACDAVIKQYSPKTVCVVIVTLSIVSIATELGVVGVSWDSPSRIAQMSAIGFMSWVIFWKGDY